MFGVWGLGCLKRVAVSKMALNASSYYARPKSGLLLRELKLSDHNIGGF